MKRRFLSILFTLCMLFSLMPTTVLADETGTTVTVSTTEEFNKAINDPNVSKIILGCNLELSGTYNTTGKTISGERIVVWQKSLTFNGTGTIESDVDVQGFGTLGGGNFNGTINNLYSAKIEGGTFYGSVNNNNISVIRGGTFYGSVNNNGSTISGGIFYGNVTNEGIILDDAKVSVIFESNDGNAVEEQKVLKGQKATQPTNPSKEGYTFTGWYTSENCDSTTAYNFDTPVVEPKTLYAGWSMNSYTVTFKDGENVLQSTVNHGSIVSAPERVMKTGYTFDGWYTDETCKNKYDFDTKITGDLILYAKWNINQYTITVHPDNGEKDITIKQDYGTDVAIPTLTKEGYTFNGWSTTFPTTMSDNDMEITALWKDDIAPTGKIQISDKTGIASSIK